MLIVIEGVDGSGKQTQTEQLIARLSAERTVRKIFFPNYASNTSALVKMYLGGEFGKNVYDVNPYAASSFYAVDRIGSYLSDWKKDLDAGDIVVSDRYTTSNAVHQAGKLAEEERDTFLDWLFDYEYRLLGIPKPDLVFFLNMPPDYSQQLMQNRQNKITGESELDIHESNRGYLQDSYNNALYVAKKYGWIVIDCVKHGEIRTVEEINDEIYDMVMKNL